MSGLSTRERNLDMLMADEKSLAEKFKLKHYFENNRKYLDFMREMKTVVEQSFGGRIHTDWTREVFIDLMRVILGRSENLFSYLNDIHANQEGHRNIKPKQWKYLLNICSKIIVYWGLDNEIRE